jgi:hypothetical protein
MGRKRATGARPRVPELNLRSCATGSPDLASMAPRRGGDPAGPGLGLKNSFAIGPTSVCTSFSGTPEGSRADVGLPLAPGSRMASIGRRDLRLLRCAHGREGPARISRRRARRRP